MIESWKQKGTKDVFHGCNTKAARKVLAPELHARARELLDRVEAAEEVGDLRIPPGNGLEKLSHDRKGQWSLRINGQFRICFWFEKGNARDVEIVDYH